MRNGRPDTCVEYPLLGDYIAVTPDHLYWQQLHKMVLQTFTPKMPERYLERPVDAETKEVDRFGEYANSRKAFDLEKKEGEGVFDPLTRTIFTHGIDKSEILETFVFWLCA